MCKIHKYALITDDSIFGSIISSYFYTQNCYFPIISLPRMERVDWNIEVLKRVTSINRARFDTIFCKGNDYGLLASLRSKLNVQLIPIETPNDLHKFSDFTFPTKSISCPKDKYLNGLILSSKGKSILELIDGNSSFQYPNIEKDNVNSETLVVIEVTNEITDVSAVNYALSKNYDIKFINPISKDNRKEIKNIFRDLSTNHENYNEIVKQLDLKIKSIFDYQEIETQYKQVLFIISEIPLGILIENIPIAHLSHLQSDLRLLDETFYLDLQKNENLLPSFLFVDIQSNDLISEMPEIDNDLDEFKIWKFNLNGKFATRKNFKVYSRFFPFDLLFVSGHGSWPECREVIYRFKGRDSNNHTIKLLEYFQFGDRKGDKIELETKEYILEVDGISWDDKDTLRKKGISHLFREYVDLRDTVELVEEKDADPKQIEGLLLHDGIFLGTVHNFTLGNNPIIFLNTCGSLYEIGGLLDFAGARVLIGTMWSIYDNDANKFAKSFFRNIPHCSLLKSFYKSRAEIENKYSKLSYVYFGIIDSFLIMKNEILDESAAKEIMAQRLLNSFKEAVLSYYNNSISEKELIFLLNFINITENFISSNVGENIELRKNAQTLRNIVELFE